MSEDRSTSAPTWIDKLSRIFQAPKDNEALLALLRAASENKILDADMLAIIEGGLGVSHMQARDIMIPRSQIVMVSRDAPQADILQQVTDAAHSRFPVVDDDRDDVIGILLAKDLLTAIVSAGSFEFNLRDILRPAVFIPESKRLNVLLREFRTRRNHMAIVVDEYGGVAGMVTIENVLEQIVGEIEDEHDIDEVAAILKRSDTEYHIKALTEVDEFNAHFETTWRDDEFDTIGGIITQKFGHLPKRDETITIEQFQFKVVRADNRRVHLFEMTVLPETQNDAISLTQHD